MQEYYVHVGFTGKAGLFIEAETEEQVNDIIYSKLEINISSLESSRNDYSVSVADLDYDFTDDISIECL